MTSNLKISGKYTVVTVTDCQNVIRFKNQNTLSALTSIPGIKHLASLTIWINGTDPKMKLDTGQVLTNTEAMYDNIANRKPQKSTGGVIEPTHLTANKTAKLISADVDSPGKPHAECERRNSYTDFKGGVCENRVVAIIASDVSRRRHGLPDIAQKFADDIVLSESTGKHRMLLVVSMNKT